MYDAVNGSDLRKVREWLEVRGPVSCDNYQMAHYLQAVASKTSRRRLAQFRMGSHMLGRKIYMYALAKPHGSCRGSSGSDMHKQIRNQNRDIKHPTA